MALRWLLGWLSRLLPNRESATALATFEPLFPPRIHHAAPDATLASSTTSISVQPARPPLPIVVISYNRADFLLQSIASYRAQTVPVRIVVHDNGSTDPATLAALDELERQGAMVFRRPPIRSADDLNQVDETVQEYSRTQSYAGPYAVTDCDIDLSSARPDALELYLDLLDQFPEIECAGPMLRIADVPRSYALFQQAMERHVSQFWHAEPRFVQTRLGRVAVLHCPFDTTLAIHRAGQPFRRLRKGFRVYHPFEARHLDWYIEIGAEDTYRATSSPHISHWNNANYIRQFGDIEERLLTYKVVEEQGGELRVVQRTTADNPA